MNMEEMNATVLEVARNAANAAASADAAKHKAITGAEGVRSAVTSIEGIRQRILELKASMAGRRRPWTTPWRPRPSVCAP